MKLCLVLAYWLTCLGVLVCSGDHRYRHGAARKSLRRAAGVCSFAAMSVDGPRFDAVCVLVRWRFWGPPSCGCHCASPRRLIEPASAADHSLAPFGVAFSNSDEAAPGGAAVPARAGPIQGLLGRPPLGLECALSHHVSRGGVALCGRACRISADCQVSLIVSVLDCVVASCRVAFGVVRGSPLLLGHSLPLLCSFHFSVSHLEFVPGPCSRFDFRNVGCGEQGADGAPKEPEQGRQGHVSLSSNRVGILECLMCRWPRVFRRATLNAAADKLNNSISEERVRSQSCRSLAVGRSSLLPVSSAFCRSVSSC